MNPITVTIHVNAAAAVRDGRGRSGPVRLELGDAEIGELTGLQRIALHNHLSRTKSSWGNKGPQWADPLAWHGEPVANASLHVLKKLLDRRALVMDQFAALFQAPTSGKIEDVLIDLARHMPRRDVAGYSWCVVQAALMLAAERCEDLENVDPPDPKLALGDDPPWAAW